ncbi:MAG: HipA domain-containing protein [Alphaproteobacteria bacterium]|nr:HipA domain-containing protein [Alphaproteobacteria bacterium]
MNSKRKRASARQPANAPHEAYVWIWLPGEAEPVVAGRMEAQAGKLVFNYGQSYLARENAIPIYEPELPLKKGVIEPLKGLSAPGCIRDASPDAWGRRVIINRLVGAKRDAINDVELSELTYLLQSGSDRIGALDFQASPDDFQPRLAGNATLEELIDAAGRVERGEPLPPDLNTALFHGSSIGGARPKALIDEADRRLIAKFSALNDIYSVVKAEFIAMRLAARAGLHVAEVRLAQAAGKDVLLIERFDRVHTAKGWTRRSLVSALTMLELDEMMARYASYADFAEIIRRRFTDPRQTLRELFARVVFNVLCGNTDDHARNHAAFWNGQGLTLSPAYDICPQGRAGGEATQAMLILGEDRSSQIATCLNAGHVFLLKPNEAATIVERQLTAIDDGWEEICEEAQLSPADRALFWGRQFLNPYAFENLSREHAHLARQADDIRARRLC